MFFRDSAIRPAEPQSRCPGVQHWQYIRLQRHGRRCLGTDGTDGTDGSDEHLGRISAKSELENPVYLARATEALRQCPNGCQEKTEQPTYLFSTGTFLTAFRFYTTEPYPSLPFPLCSGGLADYCSKTCNLKAIRTYDRSQTLDKAKIKIWQKRGNLLGHGEG